MDLPFFGISFMDTGNVVTQTLVYAGPFVVTGGIAAVYGLVGKRWGANGVFAAVLLSVVVPGLVVVLIAWQDSVGTDRELAAGPGPPDCSPCGPA